MERRAIEEVLAKTKDRFMALRGVVATGIGERDGSPCIRVLVSRKTPELLERIPTAIDGYDVVVDESGPVRPLETE